MHENWAMRDVIQAFGVKIPQTKEEEQRLRSISRMVSSVASDESTRFIWRAVLDSTDKQYGLSALTLSNIVSSYTRICKDWVGGKEIGEHVEPELNEIEKYVIKNAGVTKEDIIDYRYGRSMGEILNRIQQCIAKSYLKIRQIEKEENEKTGTDMKQ